MEKKTYEPGNGTHIERIILLVYSVYTIAMTAMNFLLGWGTWIPQVIIGGMILSIFMHVKKYRDYRFRALFTTCMAWMSFILYGIHSESLFSVLSTQVCMVILLGIYCIPETV